MLDLISFWGSGRPYPEWSLAFSRRNSTTTQSLIDLHQGIIAHEGRPPEDQQSGDWAMATFRTTQSHLLEKAGYVLAKDSSQIFPNRMNVELSEVDWVLSDVYGKWDLEISMPGIVTREQQVTSQNFVIGDASGESRCYSFAVDNMEYRKLLDLPHQIVRGDATVYYNFGIDESMDAMINLLGLPYKSLTRYVTWDEVILMLPSGIQQLIHAAVAINPLKTTAAGSVALAHPGRVSITR